MTQQKNPAGHTPRLLGTTLLAAGLLSGVALAQPATMTVQASAQSQIAVLQQIKRGKTAIEDKLDSALFMATLRQRGDARLAQLPEYQYLKAGKDGRYSVDIGISGREDAAVVLRKLAELGAVLVSPKSTALEYRTVRAKLRLSDLMTMAGLKQVTLVQEAVEALTNVVNVSEGDKAHAADQARGSFGATGAGVKVCALSDGVNSLASVQASGDLPAVAVLAGQAGSGDEGTAMLEIIHDLAPAATLGFASAFNSEASFAQNIRDLADPAKGHCNIIVDDVLYFDENVFQDGVVAQAVNDATAAGVLYFSSAGNSGNKTDNTSGTWEGDFLASTLANPALLAGVGPLHNFGDGGQSILVTGASTSGALIIWAENFDLTGGTASTDYDLYLLNNAGTAIVQSSINRQNGSGGNDRAYERVSPITVGQRLVVNRFAVGNTSSPPMFHLSTLRGTITSALSTSGVTRGHSATADGYGVAATPAGPVRFDNVPPLGPFPNSFTASNASESFSSDGPRRIILGPTGSELTPGNRTSTGGVVRQQPIITAADGVSTAAPGFNPFFGTSAAAPHAAAIAALLKSGVPSLTPVQVKNFLTSTAIDIEAPGVDRSTGYGIVMPLPALQAAGATPQPFLAAGTAVYTQISGDGDSVIEPNETWSISLPLTNIGAAPAATINSTLSSASPGVTITSASSTYPNLAPSASASNATAYVFRVEPAFLCGSAINFSQNLSYIGANSPQTVAFASGTGGLGGGSTTFSYTGAAVAIPDEGSAINVPLSVSAMAGAIGDINLKIDGSSCNATAGSTTVGIDHTYVADLAISLVSPDGTVVPVITNAGGAGNNFCQTVLDDDSAGPGIQTLADSQAPFTGSFKPSAPLSSFDGRDANGTWQLRAQDSGPADTGSVRAFSLSITPAVCDAPSVGGTPTLSINDVSASEGNSGTKNFTFTVSLSALSTTAVTVTATTAQGTAVVPSDYVGTQQQLTIPAGQLSTSFVTVVKGDTAVEPNETYFANLSNASGATIADGQGVATIINDDVAAASSFSVNDVSITEGNTGTKTITFTVSLTPAAAGTVSVTAATANGTATTGSDYTGGSAVLSFTAGQTSKTVSLPVKGDTTVEPDETFFVNLTNPTGGAVIADAQGIGTIVNDDGPSTPSLSINDVTVTEGNTGTGNATFTISLSAAATSPVTVAYATANGTATAGSDYLAGSGTLTIPTGSLSVTVGVVVNGDTTVEPNETFVINLSSPSGATIVDGQGQGTISNDDAAAGPSLSINDVSVVEGNSGSRSATFTVTLSPAASSTVTFTATTANGTAIAGSDYTGGTLTLSFAAGQTSKTAALPVRGDTAVEPDETFFVNLSNPTGGAVIGDAQGIGTIVNDD